ncbi:MAG: leucyl aminopeptidase [Noviherbaspirillum sp.]|nr:leucyl aminopeptidase [Noviherbaspirillum sp.]MDB5793996.1 leucyl aminopeptidase [Noviherbaspirillum sp.]
MDGNSELVKVFGAVLDLCKVKQGETLVALTQGGERGSYAAAFVAAAQERGAFAYQMNVPTVVPQPGSRVKRTSLSGNVAAVQALKSADIVIDLVGLLWSAEQKEIQTAGARILLCRESVETIVRMFPTQQLRRRVEAAAKRLGAAKEMRITSPAGTDVIYKLGKYPVVTQYGYTDEPGRWDHLAGGFLYTGGDDDGINGTVVINAGDILLPFKRYVNSPVTLTVRDGRIEGIEGNNLDAEVLRTYMARWNDPRAYAVSHIGWGMDEKAQWDFLATNPLAPTSFGTDGRSYYGNVLFSTGPNSELGGTNDTGCHLDIPLRGCSLYLDGEPVVVAGDIIPDDLRALGR